MDGTGSGDEVPKEADAVVVAGLREALGHDPGLLADCSAGVGGGVAR